MYPKTKTIVAGRNATFIWMKGADYNKYSPITQCYGIVINEKMEILMGRKVGKENWVIPGGKTEKGETPLETLKREFIEEVDLEILKAYEIGLQEAYFDNEKPVYQARYLITEFKLLPQTPDPDGGSMWERKWVPLEEFKKILNWGVTGGALVNDAVELFNGMK